MKTTILISSIALIIGSITYLNKPTKAIGSESYNVKTNSTLMVECPVVGNGLNNKPQGYPSDDSSGIVYEHCQECNTGVYYTSKENVIQCTFCGKEKR
jgi:hypothetical protein